MLRKKALIESIGITLAHLKACVATLNEVRFFDLNVAAEDFFANLLNAVFGYSLVNLNHSTLNAVAVDLGDKTHRIAVQVTSERTKAKVQKTVDQFSENGLASDYDTLKVLLIGDRTGDYPGLLVPQGVTFSGKTDVIDISDLMRVISRLDVSVLETIDELLRREIKAHPAQTQVASPSPTSDLVQIDATQKELLLQQQASESQQSAQLAGEISELRGLIKAIPATLLPDAVASVHEGSLDVARDLLKQNKPRQALALLEKQKPAIWPSATNPIKARLLCSMAVANHALGLDSQAAHLFLEARQFNPDDDKVLSNVAVGYLLLDQRDKAAEMARFVLARNPTQSQARSVLIQSSDESLEKLIADIPESCRTVCEVAMALGFVARKRGAFATANSWLRTAVQNDADDHPDIKGTLAEVIVNRITGDPMLPVRIGQLTHESQEQLEYAVSLLDDACTAIGDDDALRPRITWLLNAVIATRLLGKQSEADTYLARATKIAPTHAAVVYQCAIAARERNDLTLAINLARSLYVSEEIPHAPLFMAQLLWEADRRDEAIRELLTYLESTPAGPLAHSARQMLIELYLSNEQLADALRLSDEVIAADPTDVSNLVVASQVRRAMGQTENADASLDKAVRVVGTNTPPAHLVLLGNELGAVARWPEAADILEKVVVTTTDSPLTRKYLHACYRGSKLDKALVVCQQLRESGGPLEFVTEIEIAVLEETGNLTGARSVCEHFIAAFPDDGQRRVQLAVIYLRQHDHEALDAFLNNPPDWRQLPVESVQQIAHLYAARKRYRESVEMLYELRRTHSLGKVHLQYLQTFLFQDDHKHEWLEVNSVGVDVAVCVKDSSGETEWYIVEDRKDADITKGELPPTHRLAIELMGKVPGDTVLLRESSMSTEQGTIAEIKSKYLHAFHESAKVFEVRYPEQSGSFISMKLPEGEAGVKELLQKLGKQEDERKQRSRKTDALYQSNPLPIGAVARMLGCDIIQAWSHLTSNPESRLISSSGTPSERDSSHQLLDAPETRLVIDPVALMTIHALALADEVVQTVGRLGISQSTIDLLTEILLKRTSISRGGFMRLTKEKESFVRQGVTAEQVEASLLSLETLIAWVESNCDVMPWSPALLTKREERKELEEIVGDESLDTVLSASGPGRALFSDDLRLRQLAKVEFKVEGIATQPILMRAVDEGVIDRDRYNKAVVQLAAAGYVHTSIDAHVLLEAARQAESSASPPFSSVTWLLTGQYCDENSAVRVAADFLRLLWRQPVLPRSTDYLVFRLLDELASGRNAFQVSDKLLVGLSQLFVLNPVVEAELSKMIQAWRTIRVG